MENGHATGLIQAIQAFRKVYEHENQHLSPVDRASGWKRYWNSISAQATTSSESPTTKVHPSKRSASKSFGVEHRSSKPPGLDHLGPAAHTHPLQRQLSAPAGCTNRSPTCNPASRVATFDSSGKQSLQSRATDSVESVSFPRPGLGNIDEVHIFSPADYLEHSRSDLLTPPGSLTPSPAVERGEFNNQITSNLTYHEAFDQSTCQPMASISTPSLVSGSTALSEAMTRSDTNDVLCKGIDMFRMTSMSKSESVATKPEDPNQALPFSYSPNMVHTDYHELSCSGSPPPFSYSSEMQPSLSHESDGSSHFSSVHSSPRLPESTASGRWLAPKLESNKSLSPTEHHQVKLVEVTGEDGTVTRKAEIARAARREPDRKTLRCPHCDDNPNGFHGVHELDRHIDRHHAMRRKVWICKESVPGGTFLANCKACRNKKTYGANYNAAAHLRRAHFNPPKNKRGGRGKKSEGRGGMGGGNKPSMDELKNWMYEEWEENTTSKILASDGTVGPEPIEAYQRTYYDAAVPGYPLDYTNETMIMSGAHHQCVGVGVGYAAPTTIESYHSLPPTNRPHWGPTVY